MLGDKEDDGGGGSTAYLGSGDIDMTVMFQFLG